MDDRVRGVPETARAFAIVNLLFRECPKMSHASKTFYVKIDAGKASTGRIQKPTEIERNNEVRDRVTLYNFRNPNA